MVQLKKVDRSMFPQVYELLLEFNNEHLTREDWRKLYDYPWETNEGYCGYALIDGDSVVGFISMIFSERVINGRVERFCNLANWIVKPEYRSQSLTVLLPSLKLTSHTLTDFTPSDQVREISKRLGFKDLDGGLRVLLPPLMGPLGMGWRNPPQITTEPSQMAQWLQPDDFRIFQDHQQTQCRHLLLRDGNSYCYVIFSTVRTNRGSLRYSSIHFISNKELFAKHSMPIRSMIMRTSRSPLVVVDRRLVADLPLRLSFDLPVQAARLYKSATVKPEEIDNLYSELVLANVSTLPGLRTVLAPIRRLARRVGVKR